MKKTLFFAIMALMAFGASAATSLLFNRAQFQAHKATADTPAYMLTAPLVYKGTVTLQGTNIDDAEAICVVSKKTSYPAYMTICQPCIDCYPCRMVEAEASDEALDMPAYGEAAVDPGKITKWNLYLIKEDKKAKTATIYKIDLAEAEETVFFTGPVKGEGDAKGVNEASFFMTGKKSDYKFSYIDAYITTPAGDWETTGAGKKSGYIKSVNIFTGSFTSAAVDKGGETALNCNASIKLTRNASLTGEAFKGVFGAEVKKNGSKWDDCTVEVPATVCEEYFAQGWSTGDDAFDAYLESIYAKKKFETEAIDAMFGDVAAGLFE